MELCSRLTSLFKPQKNTNQVHSVAKVFLFGDGFRLCSINKSLMDGVSIFSRFEGIKLFLHCNDDFFGLETWKQVGDGNFNFLRT
jgi:hypothetical protein